MLPLAAYADRLSARPGEVLEFKVSNRTGAKVSESIVRVISADANPAGPGVQLVPVDVDVEKVVEPGPHNVALGSYARVDMRGKLAALEDFTFAALVMPTRLASGVQVIASWHSGDGGVAVLATGDGGLRVTAAREDGGSEHVTLPGAFEEMRWHEIEVRYEQKTSALALTCRRLDGARTVEQTWRLAAQLKVQGDGPLFLAGDEGRKVGQPFNGRLERPRLFSVSLPVLPADDQHEKLVAAWDFSRGIETDRIKDIGPHGLDGVLVNQPTRAVTGASWTGREMSWRHAPEEYGAVHFHEDDIADCNWPTAFRLTVPADMKSGCYALLLDAAGTSENVPFFVVPPKGKATARIALLVSTFTYAVYANHARPEWMMDPVWRAAWERQTADWRGYPHNPGAHRDYGLSTYNYHTDGSGIALATWHRPILNLRVGYLTYPYPDIRGSGLRHYPADSHLTAWLDNQGYDFDVITDWELHTEGYELLRRYAVLLTGTHPEYHTRQMLDALAAYRDGGGRFCYLGGNGFYWKIALHPEKPGIIEIRRGEGGIRAWAAEPGEYYNQFDGEYGGLWRRNGRPPQRLSGVGFTAQGNFVGSHYRLLAEARDPRVAWMLAGIEGPTIGGYGLSGHGAAGFELDRTDKRLGTPAHAVVIARSENHPPEAPWVLVPEEQLTHLTTVPGQPARDLIHADVTFFETAGGKGAVFSTGSITFCGSLPHNGFDNDISRLLRNVVDRFLDPALFEAAGQ